MNSKGESRSSALNYNAFKIANKNLYIESWESDNLGGNTMEEFEKTNLENENTNDNNVDVNDGSNGDSGENSGEHKVPLKAFIAQRNKDKEERDKLKRELAEKEKYAEFAKRIEQLSGKTLDELELQLNSAGQANQPPQTPPQYQPYQQPYRPQPKPQVPEIDINEKLEEFKNDLLVESRFEGEFNNLAKREEYRSIRSVKNDIKQFMKAFNVDVESAAMAICGKQILADTMKLKGSTKEETDSESYDLNFTNGGNFNTMSVQPSSKDKQYARMLKMTDSEYIEAKSLKNKSPEEIRAMYMAKRNKK